MRTIVSLPLALLSFGVAVCLYGTTTTNADVAKNNPTTTFVDMAPVSTTVLAPLPAEQIEAAVPAVVEPEPSPILRQYLEDSMLKWVSLPDCDAAPAKCAAWEKVELEKVDHARERFHNIANDVAQAAAVEQSPFGSDLQNARMAEVVLSLAFMESRFREYVDDGRCNDEAWQATEEGGHLTGIGGTCDHSKRLHLVMATSLWQIHADQGIILMDSKKTGRDSLSLWDSDQLGTGDIKKVIAESEKLPRGFGNYVTKENIRGTDNRLLAARTAWHLAKGALRASKLQDICAYTGEWGGECPKSEIRLRFAKKWWDKHPFTLPKE